MKVLKINSSANKINSISRNMVDLTIDKIKDKSVNVEILDRDVAYDNLPYIDQEFINAMFNKGSLTPKEKETLKLSNQLIDELISSDILVIGAPIYNFTIPSTLKSYFDLVARPGRTFNYTGRGVIEGLVKDKTVFVVITSGGTKIGSDIEHSSKYITTFLNFIGITDIHFIEMDQSGFNFNEKVKVATEKIQSIADSML